jgi:hypothetical protein
MPFGKRLGTVLGAALLCCGLMGVSFNAYAVTLTVPGDTVFTVYGKALLHC